MRKKRKSKAGDPSKLPKHVINMTPEEAFKAQFEGQRMTAEQMLAQARRTSGPSKDELRIMNRSLDEEREERLRGT